MLFHPVSRHSAIARAWSPVEESAYFARLSPREAVFVANVGGRVVGFQTLDRWASYPSFMDHVGQLGTFLLPEWRGARNWATARASDLRVRAQARLSETRHLGPGIERRSATVLSGAGFSRVRSAFAADHGQPGVRRQSPDGTVSVSILSAALFVLYLRGR